MKKRRSLQSAIKGFVFAGLVVGFLAVVAFGFLWVLSGGDIADFARTTLARISVATRQQDLNQPQGVDDTPIRFTVDTGSTPIVIAGNLYNTGLISDAGLFVDYVRAENLDTELEAGIYFLNQTQTIPEIALKLTDSRSSFIPFRVLEGTRIEEIAQQIDDSQLFGFTGADFLAVVQAGAPVDPEFASLVGLPDGASYEGFLMPDSYQLPPEITALELRDTLTENFLARTGEQLRQDALEQGLSLFDAVNLAAIIEREAVWNDEHTLISSVYRNRLDNDMLLQADPTVQYGLNGARGRWWPNISIADYRGVNSLYNTYLHTGLPPGPIANPSISAIRGAVYPAESSYFYFRAACDGSNRHQFATTYDEHLTNGC